MFFCAFPFILQLFRFLTLTFCRALGLGSLCNHTINGKRLLRPEGFHLPTTADNPASHQHLRPMYGRDSSACLRYPNINITIQYNIYKISSLHYFIYYQIMPTKILIFSGRSDFAAYVIAYIS